jgi:hypothetical protein
VSIRNKEDAFVDEESAESSMNYLFQGDLHMNIPGEGSVTLSPERIKKLTPKEVQDLYQVGQTYNIPCFFLNSVILWHVSALPSL